MIFNFSIIEYKSTLSAPIDVPPIKYDVIMAAPDIKSGVFVADFLRQRRFVDPYMKHLIYIDNWNNCDYFPFDKHDIGTNI